MTTQQLKTLRALLNQFSSDYHSYDPPYEISATLDLLEDAIREQEEEERQIQNA